MKTCPKCKTTKIPAEANFCPNCGQKLIDGVIKLVCENKQEKFIYLTNYTDVLFDVSLTHTSREWLFPHKTIQLPNILYKTITAAYANSKVTLRIDEDTPSYLKLVFKNDIFVIVEDNKHS
jgi:hypothetical protein